MEYFSKNRFCAVEIIYGNVVCFSLKALGNQVLAKTEAKLP